MEEMLYHYTKLETFLIHILPQKELLFSRMGTSRDPNEYKSLSRYSYTTDENETTKFNDFREALEKYKFNSKFLCFSMENHKGNQNPRHEFDRLRMWDQYGDGNNGICLGFSKDKLISTFTSMKSKYSRQEYEFFNDPINYLNFAKEWHAINAYEVVKDYAPPPYIEKYLSDKRKRDFLFFSKDENYGDENEFRLLILTQKDNCTIKISITESLSEIIIGDNLPTSFWETYMPLIKSIFPDVNVFQMKWNYGIVQRVPY
ncbi:Protein of unknown function (DUF2971) [Sphaerochaeta pleomorpha str. Grapes]|uniref:DUF2971 domain-containing protein n=1 Tax=Sphaerochaeta pleomorpha (strain ATCC BAA-1885 / DSM 22778 / Grapes) TaxID=158190 RepID=G8QZ15_SPHPG|nr:DUF2971 domain-containing protein [Sphaerochaeta pleomorpha]AEV30874.1 Protein of unknown function (DUF2971) [Sphaerochaeta pleomorpha str. Grapes]